MIKGEEIEDEKEALRIIIDMCNNKEKIEKIIEVARKGLET